MAREHYLESSPIYIACNLNKQAVFLPTSDQHGDDGEYLFGVRVWGHVSEPDTGEAGAGEVQR